MAPETPKIRKMADAIESNENAVLGIASGITPENVEKYHYASCFLAATGVSDDFNHLNPERVRSMVETLDRMNQRKKNKSK
jgi:predicted TIM-barrel enzyme